ncbi:DEAD/DEAH box helicase, partial [Clostridium perfringens]|uniref:DEAD/DEAH box helicase n=1 Tax=Clostridium perfringens TaxID=1502 RepID=UPI002AC3C133
MKFYEEQVRNSILANKVNEEDVSKILKDFKFKDEILFSLNKEYKRGIKIDKFCRENNIDLNIPNMLNFHGSLYKHQENAIKAILNNKHTIVSTGTGSGKTESFLIPIFDYCLKNIGKKGIKAIIIYPMNALAGDQLKRIDSAVKGTGITYAIFSGQTPTEAEKKKSNRTTILSREEIVKNKPDILVTNYVMLERILINQEYRSMLKSNDVALKYVVLDEIHTYNGNKALHLKFLLNRLRNFIDNDVIQIGSSATLSRKKNKKKTDG